LNQTSSSSHRKYNYFVTKLIIDEKERFSGANQEVKPPWIGVGKTLTWDKHPANRQQQLTGKTQSGKPVLQRPQ
jgi:hypothetical protein